MTENQPTQSLSIISKGILGIVVIIAVAFLVPIAAPLIGLILMIGGLIFHKKSIDPSIRNLTTLYAITGLLLVVISILILLMQVSVR